MKVVKPMRWKEGLFLRPHHFQQQDLYLEAREFLRFQALDSFAWGLIRLKIDEGSLDNFVFNVQELRAIFRDGTLVDVPGNGKVASRAFDTLMTEVGRPLDIHLGIRARDDRGPQTLSGQDGMGDARFLPDEEEVYDLDAGRNPAPVERLSFNLRIFLGDEQTDGYEALPLARLVRTGDVAHPVKADKDFAPPALVLGSSPVLQDAARAVVERLALALRDIGQKRGGNDPDPLILYHALSGSLPVLGDMVQDGMVHPRRLYQEMARLAGALFYRDKRGRSAEEIPAYDHYAPGPVFTRLHELIFELSEIAIQRLYQRCPMEREGDRFRAVLPAEAKQSGARFFLEVLADDSTPKVPMLVLGAKVSAPGRIDHLRDHALPGVTTEKQPGQPPELPQGQAGSYFRIQHDQNEWSAHVAPAGELAVFMLGAPQDVKLNLIVILPGG